MTNRKDRVNFEIYFNFSKTDHQHVTDSKKSAYCVPSYWLCTTTKYSKPTHIHCNLELYAKLTFGNKYCKL